MGVSVGRWVWVWRGGVDVMWEGVGDGFRL